MAITFSANDWLKGTMGTWNEGMRERLQAKEEAEAAAVAAAAAAASAGAAPPAAGRQLTVIESMVAGGAAGAVSKTVIAPADRVKILYQVNKARTFSLRSAWGTAATIVTHSGVRGLWRGNAATMMRVIPYSAVRGARWRWR